MVTTALKKIYEAYVPVSCFGEKQIKPMLKTLTAKAGLEFVNLPRFGRDAHTMHAAIFT